MPEYWEDSCCASYLFLSTGLLHFTVWLQTSSPCFHVYMTSKAWGFPSIKRLTKSSLKYFSINSKFQKENGHWPILFRVSPPSPINFSKTLKSHWREMTYLSSMDATRGTGQYKRLQFLFKRSNLESPNYKCPLRWWILLIIWFICDVIKYECRSVQSNKTKTVSWYDVKSHINNILRNYNFTLYVKGDIKNI